MGTALLLIDLQVDFLSGSGRMPVGAANAERVIATANRLIALFAGQRRPIVTIVNQFGRNDLFGNFFRRYAAMEGTEGGKMDPRVTATDALCIAKNRASAFTNPELATYLKQSGIDHVVICGVYAEGCVRATALDALRANLRTTLIAEGVASNRSAKYRWALSHLKKRGARVLTLADYLSEAPPSPEQL